MEISHLEQLVAIAECGTLSKAAEKLYISQPALSRSMQKLEQELGVELFTRQKNKMELNDTGKFACEYARTILRDFNILPTQIRDFDRHLRTINVGSCTPAPLWEILPVFSTHYPDKLLSSEIKPAEDELVKDLLDENYQIIITTESLNNPDVFTIEAGHEKLFLNVPRLHPLAKKKDGVYFSEIEKYSVLLFAQTGAWEHLLRREMPNVHIIMQDNRESFTALRRESALLSFSTELSIKRFGTEDNLIIPILDKSATLNYYLHILKKHKDQFGYILALYQ